MEISNIFNTEGIEKTKEELISMYKSGELSSAEMLGQFPKLNQAIKRKVRLLQVKAQLFIRKYSMRLRH